MVAYREDEEIDADDLIQLWLAEGLVKTREEGRHGFLKNLANRCLVEVEVTEENGYHIRKVKIHDVLRDMAVHVAEVDQNILFRARQSLTEFPKSARATSVRISVMHNRIRILPESVDCVKLVALLLSWNTVEEVPEGFLEKLNMLKVLGLSYTPIKFLLTSIHQLTHLLYLQLSNTQIKLKSSQILLTLSGLGLARLSNLNEIDIEECLLLTKLGEDFGRKGCFPRLRKLKLWMLPSLESVCSFIEEGALPMLQTLTIFRCMKVKVLPR
ncbi:hypothetical protein SUGI_0134040 [Cryptomeria japonica]|nr:hypothetical protein SUGI_0134040 [Cryptomeria japonica]